jgi:hypothetical protein
MLMASCSDGVGFADGTILITSEARPGLPDFSVQHPHISGKGLAAPSGAAGL